MKAVDISKFEKVHDRHREIFQRVSELDALCFNDGEFEKLSEATEIFGDIYALWRNADMVGYVIYGQVWLPEISAAYISRIGVHPDYRQNGWGLRILNNILSDLRTCAECSTVYADIRQSNIASQQLFRKAGFYVYCEWDGFYPDEIGIRVMKKLDRRSRRK